MKNWNNLETELLADTATKQAFDRLVPRYAIISELIQARLHNHMTQADVAKKIGTQQSAIARLESGAVNPSLEFLQRVAHGVGYQLTIHLTK